MQKNFKGSWKHYAKFIRPFKKYFLSTNIVSCPWDTALNKTALSLNLQYSWGTDMCMIKLKSMLSRRIILIYMSLKLSIYACSFGVCMRSFEIRTSWNSLREIKMYVVWLLFIMNQIPNNFGHYWFRKHNPFQCFQFPNKAFIYICIVFSIPSFYGCFLIMFSQCFDTFCHWRIEHYSDTWNGWWRTLKSYCLKPPCHYFVLHFKRERPLFCTYSL